MWKSRWVWLSSVPEKTVQRCFFRRRFSLSETGVLHVHCSADSRYKLYLDERWIGEGPAAGDLMNYRYESYGEDDSIVLKPGEHIVAIEVLSFGRVGPVNEVHDCGALIVEGGVYGRDGECLVDLCTPGDWRICEDPSFSPDYSLGGIPYYCALGFTENIDFRKSVGNWRMLEFDDAQWDAPVLIDNSGIPVFAASPSFTLSPWLLMPRDIPEMEKSPGSFLRVVSGNEEGRALAWQKLFDDGELIVPANADISVVLAPETYVTAYPELEFDQGCHATIRLTYAEAFSKNWQKEVRDDPTGKTIEGYFDTLTSGGKKEFYFPFQWRAFRFLKVDIQTEDELLVLSRLRFVQSSYPLKKAASWNCNEPLLNDLWPISWRSLRAGAHEHLQDSPYYEKLQYVGDTLIQSLIIKALTGDTGLWRRAVLDYHASRLPMGLTQSRYPSRELQVIPPFSLIYISLVEEYFLHTADEGSVRRCLFGLEQIIEWFIGRLTDRGFLGALPWWNFVDWTTEWPLGDPSGMSLEQPENKKPSCTHNFMLIYALQSLSQLFRWLGDEQKAVSLLCRAGALQCAVREVFWDEHRELFVENEGGNSYSEHANVLAILTDAVTPSIQRKIAKSLDGTAPLVRSGYQFELQLSRALAKVGRNDLMKKRLNHWRKVFDLHLVTTPERRLGDGEVSRSDNHAWAAWTPYWMLSEVLGVKPLEPGFKKIGIYPQLSGLRSVLAEMPLPFGTLKLSIWIDGNQWFMEGSLPLANYEVKDLSGCIHELCGGDVCLKGSL